MIALSRGGPRYIAGDFNHPLSDLRGWEVLKQAGWRDSQELAHELWGQDPIMTFRESTITDFILLSPELVQFVTKVQGWNWFADHAALGVQLEVPAFKLSQSVWPLPAEIPWDKIDYEAWRQYDHKVHTNRQSTPQERIEAWADQYEESFDRFMRKPVQHLPGGHRGRCKRLHPVQREVDCPLPKASRPGEVQAKTDLLGRSVQRWFQQLRRLQSFQHARRAGKETADAVEYRASLWRAIDKAKGFSPTFREWWKDRPTKLSGLPEELPHEPPPLALTEAIFEDFLANYRSYESWHARQRHKLLKLQYEHSLNKIFEVTRKEPKGGVSYLLKSTKATVLGADPEGQQLHLDLDKPLQLPATLQTDSHNIPVNAQDGPVVSVEGEWLFEPGTEVEVQEHAVTPEQVHQQLMEFWGPRWWKDPMPSPSDWERILNFAKAFLPSKELVHKDISIEAWTDINKRYGPHAARGPDGVSHRDLQRMGHPFKATLVEILNDCESQAHWPKALLTGFVHSLSKKPEATQVNEFRPVIIYSTIYRSWGSLRAKRFLQFLSQFADERQLGFMEGREAAELWLLLSIAGTD